MLLLEKQGSFASLTSRIFVYQLSFWAWFSTAKALLLSSEKEGFASFSGKHLK